MVVTLQKQFIHFFNIYYFKEFKVIHKYSISNYTFNLSCFAKVACTSEICLCSGLKLVHCTLVYFLCLMHSVPGTIKLMNYFINKFMIMWNEPAMVSYILTYRAIINNKYYKITKSIT